MELYGEGGTFPIHDWADIRASRHIDTEGQKPSIAYAKRANLVIMNPPFTRNDIRHDQLGPELEAKVKEREKNIFKQAPFKVDLSNSGPMFLVLAEHLAGKSATVALVLPFVAATNKATSSIRRFFAEEFYIDTIITSHDPKRVSFSENTGIPEMLVIMRRKKQKKPTRLIQFAINPDTATKATSFVSNVERNADLHGVQITTIPHHDIVNGDWSHVLFLANFLGDVFMNLKSGHLFPINRLEAIAKIQYVGRNVREIFTKSDMPGKHSWGSIYGAESSRYLTVENKPYTYLNPKHGKLDKAQRTWNQRGTLLLPERMRIDLTHVSAIHSSIPTLGSAWIPVLPIQPSMKSSSSNARVWDDSDIYCKNWSKAMAVYFNSSIGILSLLGVRDPRIQIYPRWSLDSLKSLPAPILTNLQIDQLVSVYKKYRYKKTMRWRYYHDPIRTEIDKNVARIFSLDNEYIDRARLELSKEPMCTNKRYL